MILDTNALSAFIDGDAVLGDRLRGESRLALPVIVLGEFRYGILGSRHRDRYEAWLTKYVPQFEVLAVNDATTHTYARVRAGLKKLCRPIPANDAWIAAIALQHRLPILSQDAHFDAVPGLRRESW